MAAKSGKLSSETDLFKGDFLKGGFVTKTFGAIKNFDTGKFTFGIIISGKFHRRVFWLLQLPPQIECKGHLLQGHR